MAATTAATTESARDQNEKEKRKKKIENKILMDFTLGSLCCQSFHFVIFSFIDVFYVCSMMSSLSATSLVGAVYRTMTYHFIWYFKRNCTNHHDESAQGTFTVTATVSDLASRIEQNVNCMCLSLRVRVSACVSVESISS